MTASPISPDPDVGDSNTAVRDTEPLQPTIDDYAWGRRQDLLSKAWATIRYHRRRARFFDMLDKGGKVITVALAMTILTKLEEIAPLLKPVFASVIGLLTLLDLIYGYADRKNVHMHLADQAAKVVEAIELVPLDCVDSTDAARWGALYSLVVANEPPVLKNLKHVCEHEQFLAEGNFEHAEKYKPIHSRLDRWTLDFASEGTSSDEWKEKKRRELELKNAKEKKQHAEALSKFK